ncbi:hypothetical protein O181_008598 [Austropuccinia psidii MF-1]|uniref:DUF659 domain-containing protein n=1 Tax=Austropuccinia psidii MF-1 TaxID=1389203 RepID=A0A9Q3BPQ7_9BASI|nr:hypothetical protein [Austropuccinia psidii MF-1]
MFTKCCTISNCHQAQFTFCNQIFNNSKHNNLFSHIKDKFKKIPFEKKATYLELAIENDSNRNSEAGLSETRNLCVVPQKRHLGDSGVSTDFKEMSKEKTENIHELLLKTMIESKIPWHFLQNKNFKNYQRWLAWAPFSVPTCQNMSEKILPVLHEKEELAMFQKIKTQNNLNLSIYGWTDNYGNSIYAVLLLQGQHSKSFIDILYLHQKHHTSENIFSAVNDTLENREIDIARIISVVTDSPSVMVKFQVCYFK